MKKIEGFSLIELMVVVAIVGILAAVAIPSYQSFVEEGRRAEGVAFAMDIASRQERYYTEFANYTKNLTADLGMTKNTSENDYYTAVVTGTAVAGGGADDISNYTIRVTPSVTDDDCGALQLDNIGRRQIFKGSVISGAVASECWR